jgi:DNA-binding NarL/FixJ family response regulator
MYRRLSGSTKSEFYSMAEFSKIADADKLFQILGAQVQERLTTTDEVFGTTHEHLNIPIAAPVSTRALNIGLIDCYQFSQECLIKAFDGLDPRPMIVPFETVHDFTYEPRSDFDLIIYYSHANYSSEKTVVGDVASIRQVAKTTPIVVLSDAEDAEHPNTIRSALKSGAQGFIPTRKTGIPITFAAIRFITAGGVFAPLDLLLTKRPDRVVEATPQSRLTPRQLAVLNHLQQGKANKIIAHELGMSESTVKVHVRNIMRKAGATNRTQAAYKAQKLWGNGELASAINTGIY